MPTGTSRPMCTSNTLRPSLREGDAFRGQLSQDSRPLTSG